MKLPKPAKKMNDLRMGDMTITDDGDLGLSIHANGKKLSFINTLGEIALCEWINEKYARNSVPDTSANAGAVPRRGSDVGTSPLLENK